MLKKAQEEMKNESNTWKIERKKEQEILQKIIEDNEYEKGNLAKEVVQMIKQSESLSRDTVGKKMWSILDLEKKFSQRKT